MCALEIEIKTKPQVWLFTLENARLAKKRVESKMDIAIMFT